MGLVGGGGNIGNRLSGSGNQRLPDSINAAELREMVFTFPPGSVIEQTVTITSYEAGDYNNVTTTGGITSYSFTLNGSTITLPFTLNIGDTFIVNVTKNDFSEDEQLILSTQ
jgi:hypothetical protein